MTLRPRSALWAAEERIVGDPGAHCGRCRSALDPTKLQSKPQSGCP